MATAAPGTDMTGICFRDQLWLNTYPLDRNLIFDYLALSPFYDFSCNNEQLRLRAIHPLDLSHLSRLNPILTYYILDGSIYQAPHLSNVFASRVERALFHISKAFTTAASKLEKIGYVDEGEGAISEPKVAKEVIDFKEVKRIDHILASIQRKLPPAPPPPRFPDGYVPPQTTEAEKGSETQQGTESQPQTVDPIIDQGPAKRMKF
ncbi:Mediator of RNA polymerase II transcription subunit 6 [Euphorbia peplus]|nr:Mediator of RNA polymerase II transcription subunit 6 [Euphorbia peplus]